MTFQTNTQASLDLMRALGRLEFRPLNKQDYQMFADAPDDAQIAFAGRDFADIYQRATGYSCWGGADDGNTIAVVAGNDTIEISAWSHDWTNCCAEFRLQQL